MRLSFIGKFPDNVLERCAFGKFTYRAGRLISMGGSTIADSGSPEEAER